MIEIIFLRKFNKSKEDKFLNVFEGIFFNLFRDKFKYFSFLRCRKVLFFILVKELFFKFME